VLYVSLEVDTERMVWWQAVVVVFIVLNHPDQCLLPLQSYPEFCRSTFDTASQPVMEAVVEMERRYGKVNGYRRVLCSAQSAV